MPFSRTINVPYTSRSQVVIGALFLCIGLVALLSALALGLQSLHQGKTHLRAEAEVLALQPRQGDKGTL